MIKKIIISSVVFFVLYAAIFSIKSKFYASQGQWQDNSLKAQKYLYSNDIYANVLVGSSLACRIETDSIKDIYNLAMSGQSVYDGLAIITKSANKPKRVFIETNILSRPANNNFLNGLTYTPYLLLKKYIPVLQDGRQPITVLGFYTKWGVSIIKDKLFPVASNTTYEEEKSVTKLTGNNTNIKPIKEDFLAKLISQQKEDLSLLDDTLGLYKNLQMLKKSVDEMKKNGVEVVFFEMPIDSELNDLPEPSVIRAECHKIFPDSLFHYIPQPNCKEYKTSDGLHIYGQEAKKYTHYFINNAQLSTLP